MDGYKVGSARIFQLFSNASGESSARNDSSAKGDRVEQNQTAKPAVPNTDAVRVSPAVQQEQAARASKVQELKLQVQSGEYQKQLRNPATTVQVAKSLVEFYSA